MDQRTFTVMYLAAVSVIFAVESDDVAQKIQNKRAEAEKRFSATHPNVSEEDRTEVLDRAWDTFGPHLNDHSRNETLNTLEPKPETEVE
jgi:acyl-CoA reductase-like NAD-dependent aldehyde dehydrogenase